MNFIRDLTDPAADRIVERHRKYWDNEDAPRALFHIVGKPTPMADTPDPHYLKPSRLDAVAFGDGIERSFDADGLLHDDFIRMVHVGVCSEALFGCPIRVSGGTSWAESCFKDWDQYDHYRLADSPWFATWIDNTRRVVDALGDEKYPFSCAAYRGPVDIASAVLTATGMLEAIIDRPVQAKHFIERITDILIEAATAHVELLPSFRNGYFNSYGTWTPGSTVTFTVDDACLFGPAHYQEFFLPHDIRLCEAFDRPFAHLHASARQHFLDWTSIPNLGLQCVIDDAVLSDTHEVLPIGPQVEELLPDFKAIRQKKSLMVYGFWDEGRIDAVLDALPLGGLSLDMRVMEPDAIRQRYNVGCI